MQEPSWPAPGEPAGVPRESSGQSPCGTGFPGCAVEIEQVIDQVADRDRLARVVVQEMDRGGNLGVVDARRCRSIAGSRPRAARPEAGVVSGREIVRGREPASSDRAGPRHDNLPPRRSARRWRVAGRQARRAARRCPRRPRPHPPAHAVRWPGRLPAPPAHDRRCRPSDRSVGAATQATRDRIGCSRSQTRSRRLRGG